MGPASSGGERRKGPTWNALGLVALVALWPALAATSGPKFTAVQIDYALDIIETTLAESVAEGKLALAQSSAVFESLTAKFTAIAAPDDLDSQPLIRVTEEQTNWILLNGLYLAGLATATGGIIAYLYRTWKILTSFGIFSLSLTLFLLYAIFGRVVSGNPSTELVGVISSCLAILVVPFATYGIHQKQILPRRSLRPTLMEKLMKTPLGRFYKTSKGWRTIAECVTMLFGVAVLSLNKYSFLVVPIYISAYMFLLDIVSLISEVDEQDWKSFLKSTLIFSASSLLIAWLIDDKTVHDYSFWVYMMGSLLTVLATSMYPVPDDSVLMHRQQNLYLFVHLTLVCLAVEQERTFLGLIGMGACVNFWISGIWYSFSEEHKLLSVIYIRLGFALMTLALAMKIPSSLTFWLAVLGIVYFNVTWTQRAHQRGSRSSELAYTVHLVTNLGLVYISHLFNYPVSLIITVFDAKYVLSVVGAVGVVLNFIWALFLSRKMVLLQIRRIYTAYRFALAGGVLYLAITFESEHLATSGLFSLLLYVWLVIFFEVPDYRRVTLPIIPPFLISCFVAMLSFWFNYTFGYYIGAVFSAYCAHFVFRGAFPRFAYLSAMVIYLIIAIILDSRLFAFFTAGGLLVYFGDAGRRSFKKKSLLSAVSISLIGGLVFTLAWVYQSYQGVFRDTVVNMILSRLPDQTAQLPDMTQEMLEQARDRVRILADRAHATAMEHKQSSWATLGQLLFWPYALTVNFSAMAPSSMVLITGLLLGGYYAILDVFRLLIASFSESQNVPESEEPVLSDVNVIFNLPRDTNNCGIVIEFLGTRSQDFVPSKVWLEVDGDQFWALAKAIAIRSEELSRFSSSVGYPVLLPPKKFPLDPFKSSKTQIRGYFHLGTGLDGEPPVPQESVRNALRKLINAGDAPITLRIRFEARQGAVTRLEYSTTVVRGVLFEIRVLPSQILNTMRHTFNLTVNRQLPAPGKTGDSGHSRTDSTDQSVSESPSK